MSQENEPLFTLPSADEFASLDDGQLAELAAGLRERFRAVYEGRRDPEIVGELSQSDVAEKMAEAVLAIEAIDAELESRAKEDDEFDATADQLADRVGIKAETDESNEDEPETEGGEELANDDGEEKAESEEEDKSKAAKTDDKKAVVASTRPTRPLPAARRHRPVTNEGSDDGRGLRVTSHAAGLGAPYGAMTLLDRNMIGEFLTDTVRRNRVQPGQKAVLAHASYDFPRERILEDGPDSHLINSQRIREVTAPQAIVASGGLCAPLPAIYELPGVETAARPVRGALPSFQAARGGVQLGATPTMGVYEDAVGVVTDEDNTAGGTLAVKNCMRIVCPDFSPVTVDSIYQCIEADNLAARAYPELMSRIGDLVNAEQARLADSKLLSAIKTGSTNVTGGDMTPGAVYHFLADVYQTAAGIRSRNRMPEGTPMQAFLPAWIIDLLALDIARGQFDRFQTRAQIEGILRNAGITPTFYLDGPSTGTGQIFAAQTAGAIIKFPTAVQWAIFPTGTWLHLDSGELQLGVVRDSSLNATNDFQIFSETWENIGFVGVESLWVTSSVCPSGETAAPAAAEVCTT
jgi:hypothetical protein